MPQTNPNEARNRAFVDYYTQELAQLNTEMHDFRRDLLIMYYGKRLEGREDCAAIIDMPGGQHQFVSVTSYAVWREARFTLDCDESEVAVLDRMWRRLHDAITEPGDQSRFAVLEAHHSEARRRIVECKHKVMDSMPEVFGMLDAGQYVRARSHADKVLSEIKQTFDEIISTYSSAALSYS